MAWLGLRWVAMRYSANDTCRGFLRYETTNHETERALGEAFEVQRILLCPLVV